MKKVLKDKLKKIQIFVTDFDGCHTDGFVYVREDGVESVRCSRRDGLGFNMLDKAGIKSCIISKETNPVVAARAKKLRIPFYDRVENSQGKLDVLKRIVAEGGFSQDEVAYLGDDLNDRDCLEYAGVAFMVADGHTSLKPIVDYVTRRKGGDHAIREICELILTAQGHPLSF